MKRYRLKSTRMLRWIGWSPGQTSFPLAEESYKQCLICVATMCDNTYGVLPTKDTHLSLGVYLSHVSVADRPRSQPYSVSSPSRGQTDTVWSKAPTTNHIACVDYLACPQNTPVSRIFRGLRGYLPRASQGPDLSLECVRCGQTRVVGQPFIAQQNS